MELLLSGLLAEVIDSGGLVLTFKRQDGWTGIVLCSFDLVSASGAAFEGICAKVDTLICLLESGFSFVMLD